jgi:pimeloyl-ACP methyl ester carboxylesterase
MAGRLGVQPPSTLGIVGHSRGGGIAILQAARDSRIRSLVTWAAISSVIRWPEPQRRTWREAGLIEIQNARTGQVLPLYTDVLDDIERNGLALDIEAAAHRIRVPWLLIHGTEDESVRFAEAERLRAAAPSDTRVMPIAGAGHTFGATHPWKSSTPELDAVFDATVSWLTTHLT